MGQPLTHVWLIMYDTGQIHVMKEPLAIGLGAGMKGQTHMIDQLYMGREEAAKRLGVGPRKLRNYVARGRLHPIRATYDERVLLFMVREVEELAKELDAERGSGELPPKTERPAA